MNLRAGLYQQQTVKLTMTQELSQAIALLQYSAEELTSFLENKTVENPLLQIELDNVKTLDPRRDFPTRKKNHFEKDKQNWIEQIGTENQSLDVYLYSQVDLKKLTEKERKIFDTLIAHIDGNGYLCESYKKSLEALGVSEEETDKCLQLIQGLEPAGVGARSLKECIYLQLIRLDEKNELAEKIILNYFTLFAEKKWREIANHLNVKLEEIQRVFDLVQTLNPRPASLFQDEKPAYIVPDVVIDWNSESFTISVYDEWLPKISFNHDYYNDLLSKHDKNLNRFLQEKHQDYQWLVKSLEQRRETILKVAMKIVEKQPDFFIKGPSYLKPMTMKNISEELGIHESTVSRAVREKYAQTPFGTFELKSFFTSTIQTTSDENTSSQQVKNLIKKLIEKEDKYKPLSDQAIVDILKEKYGVVVSRRTISKYRDQLRIPSSSKRKRYV